MLSTTSVNFSIYFVELYIATIQNKYIYYIKSRFFAKWGWSGSAMVLGKLPVLGRPTILITVGQGPISLAVGVGGVVWTYLLSSILSPLSPSLWETARYRLKYCLKGPLNLKQPTNHLCKITKPLLQQTYIIRLQGNSLGPVV